MSRTLVLGAGLSGKAAAMLLARRGESVLISDPKLASHHDRDELVKAGICIHSDEQVASLLDGITRVVVSPGISPLHPLLLEAAARSVAITTEIELGLANFSGRIVGITGTNGKSTTTSMISHMLNHFGQRAIACGNIGVPICDLLKDTPPEWLVVELSSYQLEYSSALSLDGVAFTSFSPDHLERHKTMEAYAAAKWKAAQFCDADGAVVMPQLVAAHLQGMPTLEDVSADVLVVDESRKEWNAMPQQVISAHDQQNAMLAAVLVNHLISKPIEDCLGSLMDFVGLPHRFQIFTELIGKKVINDSKATNVDAVIGALKSLDQPCYLLLGGQGKNESFFPIESYSANIIEVFAFGSAHHQIASELSARLPVRSYETLEAATVAIVEQCKSSPGVVLLSPGCASFDEFQNFEERGELFMQWITKYQR